MDSLIIFSGERYDILVEGLAEPKRMVYRIIFELMEVYTEVTKGRLERREPTVGLTNLVYEEGWTGDGQDLDWGDRHK